MQQETFFRLYRRNLEDGRDIAIGEYPASLQHRQVFGAETVWKRTDQLDAGDRLEGIGRLSRVRRLDAAVQVAA